MSLRIRPIPFMACLFTLSLISSGRAQEFQAKRETDRVDLFQNGKLITSYRFRSGTKPILWPLIGPGGTRMSREYPMSTEGKKEEHDHPHHRSLWMTFGEVNELDFWAEGKGKGEVVLSELSGVEQSADSASVLAKHVWQTTATVENATPKAVLQELCRYTVSGTEEERIIDCEYILKHADANAKDAIHFGDTKEGMFAIRVPEAMRADKAGGQILNSQGQKNDDAWGRTATWVDYTGRATFDNEDVFGITIMIHPKSFGLTGYWHVRTYGLFAHNPIGVKHFFEKRPTETPNKPTGGYSLAPGQSMHMSYRVLLHRNRWTPSEVQDRYSAFERVPMRLN